MTERYMSKLLSDGRIEIPHEICRLEVFLLQKGDRLAQSIDRNCLVLYKVTDQPEYDNGNSLGHGGRITLEKKHLDQLDVKEGDPLYFSVVGDLIIAEKACCEKCGTSEQLVEYMPCYFRCIRCIAYTIHWENEHRR